MRPDSAPQAGRSSRRAAFGPSFWAFFALALVSGAACWARLGRDAVVRSLAEDLDLVLQLTPKIAAAAQIAVFVPALLPGDVVARLLGDRAGLRGLVVATLAGAVTPGGPITSFPLVAALRAAGSGDIALIAFVTAWSTLGIQRILMWELPLMGAHFSLLRIAVSLPLPFIAAAIATMMIPKRP